MTSIDDASGSPLVLAHGARVLFDSSTVIRIRTGIWNYEEAAINVANESAAVATVVFDAFTQLSGGSSLEPHTAASGLAAIDRATILQLFSDLVQSGTLVDVESKTRETRMVQALMGLTRDFETEQFQSNAMQPASAQKVAIVSDSDAAETESLRYAELLGLPVQQLTAATLHILHTGDLTTGIDTRSASSIMSQLEEEFESIGTVLGLFQGPSLISLRNINRVVEHLGRPLIVGMIDGPFLSVVGVQTPYTGCFECFELRSLARLEDHITYHNFVNGVINGNDSADRFPLMSLLMNIVLTEGFLHMRIGTSRFTGRVLSIYLPTFEIQAQDLLRMPGCPACGYIAKHRHTQMNYNSRVVVDRLTTEMLD